MLKFMRFLLLCLSATAALFAQSSFEFWPGATYDPAIPTFQKVLGFEPGSRHATNTELIHYLEALSAAAPNRIKVFEYGKSWEGRKLVYAVIGSEVNMRRLPEIQGWRKADANSSAPRPSSCSGHTAAAARPRC